MIFWLAASVVACGAFLLQDRRERLLVPRRQADPSVAASALAPFTPAGKPFAGTALNVAEETRALLAALGPEAARRSVVFEMAVAPELSLHADRDAWRYVVSLLARHAARQAQERVLISARRLGERVRIAVSDDGLGPPIEMQEARLRPVAELAALQGATLEVNVHPGDGSTVALLLSVGSRGGRGAEQAPRPSAAEPYAVFTMTAAARVPEVGSDIEALTALWHHKPGSSPSAWRRP